MMLSTLSVSDMIVHEESICDVRVSLNGGIVIVWFHPQESKVTRGEINCHQVDGCLWTIWITTDKVTLEQVMLILTNNVFVSDLKFNVCF